MAPTKIELKSQIKIASLLALSKLFSSLEDPSPMLNIQKFVQNSLRKTKIRTFEEKNFWLMGGWVVQNYPSPMLNIRKFAQNSPKMGQIRTFE